MSQAGFWKTHPGKIQLCSKSGRNPESGSKTGKLIQKKELEKS